MNGKTCFLANAKKSSIIASRYLQVATVGGKLRAIRISGGTRKVKTLPHLPVGATPSRVLLAARSFAKGLGE